MLLEMQDFDFAQIQSNLPKSAQKNLLEDAAVFPASSAPTALPIF